MASCDGRGAWRLGVTMLVVAAATALGGEFAGGMGEPGNSYQIASVEQLIAVGDDPNLWDKHFVLHATWHAVAGRSLAGPKQSHEITTMPLGLLGYGR